MKKVKINNAVPAYLYDFSTEADENFSRAKLKVFYVGQTPDKRLFTKAFAEEVIKTLPYSPVVSYYDEEKDDFVGHASEQAIYGIVDPCKEVEFTKDENGTEWLICDVVLYTNRPGKVGKYAAKITGKSQSLELNPETLQYKINYDKDRKLKNIEFLKGSFLGVSVLGDDQQPAFTGSSFFTVTEDFEDKMKMLKDYCLEKTKRGKNMDKDIRNFVELSWGEKTSYIQAALDDRYGEYNTYIIDVYDTYVITYVYYPEIGECKLTKVLYELDNNSATLGEAYAVRIVYEVVVETDATQATENLESGDTVSESQETPTDKQFISEEKPSVPEEGSEGASVSEEASSEESTATAGDATADGREREIDDDDDDDENGRCEAPQDIENNILTVPQNNNDEEGAKPDEENTNTSSFTDSEREEFEALKRDKKINLINSYKEDLDEITLLEFTNKVDEFSLADLEGELAKTYRRVSQQAPKNPTSLRTFKIFSKEDNTTKEGRLSLLVNKYKN